MGFSCSVKCSEMILAPVIYSHMTVEHVCMLLRIFRSLKEYSNQGIWSSSQSSASSIFKSHISWSTMVIHLPVRKLTWNIILGITGVWFISFFNNPQSNVWVVTELHAFFWRFQPQIVLTSDVFQTVHSFAPEQLKGAITIRKHMFSLLWFSSCSVWKIWNGLRQGPVKVTSLFITLPSATSQSVYKIKISAWWLFLSLFLIFWANLSLGVLIKFVSYKKKCVHILLTMV